MKQRTFSIPEFAALCGMNEEAIHNAVGNRYLRSMQVATANGTETHIVYNILAKAFVKQAQTGGSITPRRWSGAKGTRIQIVNNISIFRYLPEEGDPMFTVCRPNGTIAEYHSFDEAFNEAQQDYRFVKRPMKLLSSNEERSKRVNLLDREIRYILSLIPRRQINTALVQKLVRVINKGIDYTTQQIKIIRGKKIFERRSNGNCVGYVVKFPPKQRYECTTFEEAVEFCKNSS